MIALSALGLLARAVGQDLYPTNSLHSVGSAFPFGGNFPSPRIFHSLTKSGDFLVVYGGLDENRTTLGDISLYHLPTQAWSGEIAKKECCNEGGEVVDLIGADGSRDFSFPFLKEGFEGDKPLSRAEHASCAMGGVVFTFGGQTTHFGETPTLLNDLYSFDPRSLSWSLLVTAGGDGVPDRRAGHSLLCDETTGSIYLFGGRRRGDVALSDLWLYSPAKRAWTAMQARTALPPPRQHAAMAQIDQTLYVFGGDHPRGRSLNDLWAFDLASLEWQALHVPASPAFAYGFAPPPLAHATLLPIVAQQGLLVYGGVGVGVGMRTALGQAYFFALEPTNWLPPLVDVHDLDQVERETQWAEWRSARLTVPAGSDTEDPRYPTKRDKRFAFEATAFDREARVLYEFGGLQAADATVALDLGGAIFAPLSNSETGETLHSRVPVPANTQWGASDFGDASVVRALTALRAYSVDGADVVLAVEFVP